MYTLLYLKWITNKDLQGTLLTGWEGSLGENSSDGRESACSVGDPGSIPSLGEENPLVSRNIWAVASLCFYKLFCIKQLCVYAFSYFLPVYLWVRFLGLVLSGQKVNTHIFLLNIATFLSISSVQFNRSVVSNSLQPHESQHARPPCPSPTPRIHSDSHPSSDQCMISHLMGV